MKSVLPVLTVVGTILLFWLVAVVPMNMHLVADQAQRDGLSVTPETPVERQEYSGIGLSLRNLHLVPLTYDFVRPRLPAPQQVAGEMYKTVFEKKITSKRSLVYHGWVTLAPTLLGFFIGTGLGILLAVGIVYSRVMDRSVMPWAIVSQTIPILALAPMVIVVLGSMGIQGLFPKSLIAAYLSFFPVVVGMVKGLRAPDGMQLDLLRTYHASPAQGFWALRLPASVPYLFASLKIGISASLIGTIVAELPTGAKAGFGARMLVGDQYGQPLVSWAALFAAALTAAALVGLFSVVERVTLRRMGMRTA
ncbi:ABC transporter permease subunit [Sulfitobacter geojensis]|uniref:ABC transporter permease subunit n=1 Tax=Sulfitobacter geojensis TaxID=1342299 RepID=A0AAE2W018_9RHOB|nr:ABC transporter permease subunit [Sulfitobacter geojensis]MBM1694480.1 ABC transporter permease subunit [Sulfitobacter geojensis]MBM1706646.1 ABC transporter permease subunit [Sulfitobacter geojensis]MBM1710704.1 ABC transporter permease subunit [Sulfitobacter geojensis]MBM1714770.1 ABC transporter permease subunit [Sulfitobacter geojensis]